MKIIEALKELPLIDKKLEKNNALIVSYAASVDAGTVHNGLKFASVEEQTNQVAALIQSSEDLVARKAKIRKALAKTNATMVVAIGAKTKTITEWIEYRKGGLAALQSAYSRLKDDHVANEVRNVKFDGTQGIKIVRHYDEANRNAKLNEILELATKIDTTLETVNATTDLIEEVA